MISVNRARLTAKRPTKVCPSADATPDISDRPKIRNRRRARVSRIHNILYFIASECLYTLYSHIVMIVKEKEKKLSIILSTINVSGKNGSKIVLKTFYV